MGFFLKQANFLSEKLKNLVGSVLTVLVLMFLVRPLNISLCTLRWAAKWLKITRLEATGAVIVGCSPLGRLLGHLFQGQGQSVVMIDTDLEACQKAEADRLSVIHSSGLDPKVLAEAGIESMGTLMTLTNNGEVNVVLAQRVVEEFQPPRVLAVFPLNNSVTPPTSKVDRAFIE